MKKTLFIVILFVITLVSTNTYAQKSYKFGHVDSNQLLSLMPERAKAKTELDNYAKQLESTLGAMQNEFQKKYQEYVESADTLSNFIRQAKEAELQEMQQRIQTFNQQAQQDLSAKENELLQPIITKAKNAIDEVGKEGGYTYIFDTSTGAILHFGADSEDILPLVKAKLGIQ